MAVGGGGGGGGAAAAAAALDPSDWRPSAEVSAPQPVREDVDGPALAYNTNMKAPLFTAVGSAPRARVHHHEWAKVLAGDPIEQRLEDGYGYKVTTIDEWTRKWKRNDDFPDCLACGCVCTREHHFSQEWCRGAVRWEAEAFCDACHSWSWRSYADPAFLTPEDREKLAWEKLLGQSVQRANARTAALPAGF